MHLVDELLDLSRIESGTLVVVLESCAVGSTIEQVIKTLEIAELDRLAGNTQQSKSS